MSSQRVFLSYSTDDRPLVGPALKWVRDSELGAAHVDDPGNWGAVAKDMRTVIMDQIRKADTVVLVWSDRAAKSAWVHYEVGMAQALGVPIRVLVAADSRAKLPAGLAKTHAVKLDPIKAASPTGAPDARGFAEPSLATTLHGLTQQYQRIEEQLQEVRALLGAPGRTGKQLPSAGRNGKRKSKPRK
jgi:TIR domain